MLLTLNTAWESHLISPHLSHDYYYYYYYFCCPGNYRLGTHRYIYREKLLRMHRRLSSNSRNSGNTGNSSNSIDASSLADIAKNANASKLEIEIAHVGEYDAALLGYLLNQPAYILPALETAAADALGTLLYDMRSSNTNSSSNADDTMNDPLTGESQDPANTATTNTNNTDAESLVAGIRIQILLKGNLKPTPLRSIKSEHMNRLLKCPGIVISNSPVKNRAIQLTVRCNRCTDTVKLYATDGPFASIPLPSNCHGADSGECGRYPYTVVPDESQFVDQQTLKLQEAPERVPTGEMPRSVLVAVERSLVDVAPPGTRVSVFCIPTLFVTGVSNNGGKRDATVKSVYLRVIGLSKDNDAHGEAVTFTPAEEEAFRALSRRVDVYQILSRSIAPNISGSYTVDIKKALTCQLLGGSRKRLPDGVRLRGDINVLLLGDPSMAKSQFLKFISKVAPVGIYTSGKGSSAAGLTASVVRDAKGEFYLEGGAMVLADGGIVCIDEFDKMRPADRVAIHEAMEQQTISIAKAGITTVLNSRSSVLAAANPVFGRYDDFKSASENIDLMTTILSRFDLIFLVRDIRDEDMDRMICQHVMGVHISSSRKGDGGVGHGGGDGGALSYMASSNMPGADGHGDDGNVYVLSSKEQTVCTSVWRTDML
jgi:DNA replication licensing factor MCM5